MLPSCSAPSTTPVGVILAPQSLPFVKYCEMSKWAEFQAKSKNATSRPNSSGTVTDTALIFEIPHRYPRRNKMCEFGVIRKGWVNFCPIYHGLTLTPWLSAGEASGAQSPRPPPTHVRPRWFGLVHTHTQVFRCSGYFLH